MINDRPKGKIMYEDYSITRDPDTGLMIVRHLGVKIGSSQTEAAAKIIRRRHSQRMPQHVCPDPAFHKSECDH